MRRLASRPLSDCYRLGSPSYPVPQAKSATYLRSAGGKFLAEAERPAKLPGPPARTAAQVSFMRWLAAACVTVEDRQFAATNCNELLVPAVHLPSLIPRRIGDDLKRVPRAESQFEVEEPISQFHCFNRRAGEAAIDFAGCVHGCRQTKLLAIVLAGESNPAR